MLQKCLIKYAMYLAREPLFGLNCIRLAIFLDSGGMLEKDRSVIVERRGVWINVIC